MFNELPARALVQPFELRHFTLTLTPSLSLGVREELCRGLRQAGTADSIQRWNAAHGVRRPTTANLNGTGMDVRGTSGFFTLNREECRAAETGMNLFGKFGLIRSGSWFLFLK